MEDVSPTTSSLTRPLDDADRDETTGRESKRQKIDHLEPESTPRYDLSGILPPSLKLLGVETTVDVNDHPVTREVDVGISEYVTAGTDKIEAIIKQR